MSIDAIRGENTRLLLREFGHGFLEDLKSFATEEPPPQYAGTPPSRHVMILRDLALLESAFDTGIAAVELESGLQESISTLFESASYASFVASIGSSELLTSLERRMEGEDMRSRPDAMLEEVFGEDGKRFDPAGFEAVRALYRDVRPDGLCQWLVNVLIDAHPKPTGSLVTNLDLLLERLSRAENPLVSWSPAGQEDVSMVHGDQWPTDGEGLSMFLEACSDYFDMIATLAPSYQRSGVGSEPESPSGQYESESARRVTDFADSFIFLGRRHRALFGTLTVCSVLEERVLGLLPRHEEAGPGVSARVRAAYRRIRAGVLSIDPQVFDVGIEVPVLEDTIWLGGNATDAGTELDDDMTAST